MKTLRTHGLFRLVMLATIVVLCVAIGLLVTQQRAEGWSAGGLPGMVAGGAHGMMAGHVVEWLNEWLKTNGQLTISDSDSELIKYGASVPDAVHKAFGNLILALEELEIMLGKDLIYCPIEPWKPCECRHILCNALVSDFDTLNEQRDHHAPKAFAVYWLEEARNEKDVSSEFAKIHAGYAMHFAMDHLNPVHLEEWEFASSSWEFGLDDEYVDKAHKVMDKDKINYKLELVGLDQCITETELLTRIGNDLDYYRTRNIYNWRSLGPGLISEDYLLNWLKEQAYTDVPLDFRITTAVNWSEQVSIGILQYVLNLKPPGGCVSPTDIPIAYIYSSWGMRTMQDEMSRLSSLEPGKYQFSSYNENSINNLWPSLSNYRILLIDEDSFYSDGSWSRYGGPLYNSFKSHAAELESFVRDGGAIFTSGENDLYRSQTWDWLPPGMQVTSYDPERTSSVHIVYDPLSPQGLYSYPNTITDSYLSQGHTHAWFTAWDPGYTPTIRRNDNNNAIELFGVFGKGAIVASHVEAESGFAWEYLQNQLRFIKTPGQYFMDILWPNSGAKFAIGQEMTIAVAIRDVAGNSVSGATVGATSPSGVPISLVETYVTAGSTAAAASAAPIALAQTRDPPGIVIYQGTYTILPTDLIGEWVIQVIGSVGGEFPKQAISVQIIENRPPIADAGPDQVVMVGGDCQATVNLDGRGSHDPDGDSLIYIWTNSFGTASGPTPNVTLPLGKHTITLTVDDSKGGTASDSVKVTAEDKTPPNITSLAVNPSVLWPPNHKMVPVSVRVSVSDNCDASPACKITSVSSTEPENGLGDGDTAPDWKITGDLTLNLRAERSGQGSGRTYTTIVMCTDVSGNSSTRNVTIKVTHDQGKN